MSDGLEGVIAARTVLSDVDGAKGRLVIRGYACLLYTSPSPRDS